MTGQSISPEDSPFSISFGGGEVEIDSNSAHVMWIRFTSDANDVYEAVLHIESNEQDQNSIEIILRGRTLGVYPEDTGLPYEFALENIYPNPFNSSTNIVYTIQRHSKVALTVYDLMGKQVNILLNDKTHSPGRYSTVWNASSFPAGVYFVRMEASSFVTVRKLLLVR